MIQLHEIESWKRIVNRSYSIFQYTNFDEPRLVEFDGHFRTIGDIPKSLTTFSASDRTYRASGGLG